MLQKDSRKQVQSGTVPVAKIQLQFSVLVVEEGLFLVTTQSVITKFYSTFIQVTIAYTNAVPTLKWSWRVKFL